MTLDDDETSYGYPAPLARQIVPEIERAILELIVEGFDRWRAEGFKRFGDHEDHYTVRLVDCMNMVRRERNLPFAGRYQHVEPSVAMLGGLQDPAHAPRIDITISWGLLTDDSYFSVECKRLAPNNLARLYVAEGIERFVRGYYGAEVDKGAMVAYLVEGTPFTAVRRLNSIVRTRPGLGAGHVLGQVDSVGSLDHVFVSNHLRTSRFSAIRLTHLVFDVTELQQLPNSTTGF